MTEVFPLIRLSLADPVEGGRRIIALNPPPVIRWMLLGAAVLVSVVLIVPWMVWLGVPWATRLLRRWLSSS